MPASKDRTRPARRTCSGCPWASRTPATCSTISTRRCGAPTTRRGSVRGLSDWLRVKGRQVVWPDDEADASGNAGLSADQAVAFEGDDHLVHRRRRDAEAAL